MLSPTRSVVMRSAAVVTTATTQSTPVSSLAWALVKMARVGGGGVVPRIANPRCVATMSSSAVQGAGAVIYPCSPTTARSPVLARPPIGVVRKGSPLMPTVFGTIRAPSASRGASTTTSSSSSSVSVPTGSPSTSPVAPSVLDWDRFFRLRTVRRRYQLVFSLVGVAAGVASGATLLALGVLENAVSAVPLDPIIAMGLVVIGAGVLGWLGGPALGTALFNASHGRAVRSQMMAKEKNFFARIRKNRVDPSTSSAQNLVPDYYGERIQSVKGYRLWLRDQRAYNQKRRSLL